MACGMTYHPKGERLANRNWRLRILLGFDDGMGRQADVLQLASPRERARIHVIADTFSCQRLHPIACIRRQQLPTPFDPQPSREIRTTSPNVLMTPSRQPLPSYKNNAERGL